MPKQLKLLSSFLSKFLVSLAIVFGILYADRPYIYDTHLKLLPSTQVNAITVDEYADKYTKLSKSHPTNVETIAKAKTVKHRENTKINSKVVAVINLIVAALCLSAIFATPFVIAIALF